MIAASRANTINRCPSLPFRSTWSEATGTVSVSQLIIVSLTPAAWRPSSARVAPRRSWVCPASGHHPYRLAGIPCCLLPALEGEVDQQGGALATGAGDRDRPAQRLDAVGEPDESRAASGGGTPTPSSRTDRCRRPSRAC